MNTLVPTTRAEQVRAGINDSLSVGLGIFPLGIALGFLVIQTGLPWWVAPALSIGVFAGSVEFLLVGMIAMATPLVTVGVTVFAVNFRHSFYAFSFPVHLTKPGIGRAYSIYAMIDEAFATAVMLPERVNSGARLISMQIACQAYWVGGSVLGVVIAAALPRTIDGFEFALVALFTVMTLDAFRSRRELPSALLAGASVALALVITPDSAMLTALILFFALLTLRFIMTRNASSATSATDTGDVEGDTDA